MSLTKQEFFDCFPYDEMRKEQKYILNNIYNNKDKYKYFLIEAPTGTGKSAIAKTIMDNTNRTAILTSTKYLQDQYESEFPDILSIKGQSNYACNVNPNVTVDKAPCKVNHNFMRNDGCYDCEYYGLLRSIQHTNYLTSYAFFLKNRAAFKGSRSYDIYNYLILDECHLLENNLINDVGFSLNLEKLDDKYNLLRDIGLEELLKVTADLQEGFVRNRDFIYTLQNILKRKLQYYEQQVKNSFRNVPMEQLSSEELIFLQNAINCSESIKNLVSKMTYFLESRDKENWVVEPSDKTLYIQPINIGKYFMERIGKFSKKIVFLSATILDMDGYIEELGIEKEEVLKIRVPSTFDSKKSPIVYIPSGKMNYQNIDKSLPKVIGNIRDILDKHKGEKGIIHTNNYKITKSIIETLNDDRLIYATKTKNNEMILKEHSESNRDTVIISPSLYTGADLKDDLSRFQVIVKLPFYSLTDRRINKKAKINPQWYTTEMFRTLIQMCGRSTRHKEDYCITYILDSSFYYYLKNNIKLFTKSFVNRICFKKEDFNIDEFREYVNK